MRILAVIVTFNPLIKKLRDLILSLIESDCEVVLIDNSSKNINDILNLNLCTVIPLPENLGIAYAQNVGIHKAIELNAAKIIFFDQDSQINNDFIQNLILDYKRLEENGQRIAAIGPQFIDEKLGFYAPALIKKTNGLIKKLDISNIKSPIEVSIIISSGSLIPVSVLKDVGLMNEDFFIDYVDTEWCFRALKKGYKIFVSSKAVMHHSVGESTVRILGVNCPVHSAFRRYYRIRNLFLMWDMMHVSKKWVIKMFIHNLIAQIILFCTQNKRSSYIYYLIIAIIDGMKGKKGSL